MTFSQIVKPFRFDIQLIVLCIFLSNVFALALPWGIKLIIDRVLVHQDWDLLNQVMLLLVVATVLKAILNYVKNSSSNIVGERLICHVRTIIYERLEILPIADIKRFTPSKIMTRLTGDLDNLRRFLFSDVVEFIYGVLSVGLIFTVLSLINFRLTLISLTFFPLFLLLYFKHMPSLKSNYKEMRSVWSNLTSRLNEVLQGMSTVRAYVAQGFEKTLFSRRQEHLITEASKAHRMNAKLCVLAECASTIGVIIVLWVGSMDVMKARMSAGELIAFYSYIGMLFSPLIRLIVINTSYQEASAALERIDALFETSIDSTSNDLVVLDQLRGRIDFSKVSFGYETDRNVVNEISFGISAGEHIGIVGGSGAGKSTLINLLMGFYHPNSGQLSIDGILLGDCDLDAYRSRVAVVMQDDYLFSGTIWENICYGREKVVKEQVIEAARIAQVHKFVSEMPQEYNSEIGERGCLLSSGQRQRVGIARALLKQPDVLVLDEATSAVDAVTENMIQRAIHQYMAGKTVITIAHRFSTIMESDRIIVMDEGRVAEIGDHHHLMKANGVYRDLYYEQFKDNDVNKLKMV